MEANIVFENEYYVIELPTNQEEIAIDENCVQFIEVGPEHINEKGEIVQEELLDCEIAEEVVECQADAAVVVEQVSAAAPNNGVTISAVYAGEDAISAVLGKEVDSSAVIVEKLPNTTALIGEEETDTSQQNRLIDTGTETSAVVNTFENMVIAKQEIVVEDSSEMVSLTSNLNFINSPVKKEIQTTSQKQQQENYVSMFESVFVPEKKSNSKLKINLNEEMSQPEKSALKPGAKKRKPTKQQVKKNEKTIYLNPKKPMEIASKKKRAITNKSTKKRQLQKGANDNIVKKQRIKKDKMSPGVTVNKKKRTKPQEKSTLPVAKRQKKNAASDKSFTNKTNAKNEQKENFSSSDQQDSESAPVRISKRQQERSKRPVRSKNGKKDFSALTRVVFSSRKDKSPTSSQKRAGLKDRSISPIKSESLRSTEGEDTSSEKVYRCGYCTNSYDVASSYYNHIRNTHGKDASPSVCTKCNHILKNRDSLLRHLRLYHTGPDVGIVHECHLCPSKFNLKGGLVSHFKNNHGIDEIEIMEALRNSKKIDGESMKRKKLEKQMKKGFKGFTGDEEKDNNTDDFESDDDFSEIDEVDDDISDNDDDDDDDLSIKKEQDYGNDDDLDYGQSLKTICKICMKIYSQISSLYRHMRMIHNVDGTLKGRFREVDYDGIKLSKVRKLKRSDKKGSNVCKTCKACFVQRSSMYRHIRSAHNKLRAMNEHSPDHLKCKACHVYFETVKGLAIHSKRKHNIELLS